MWQRETHKSELISYIENFFYCSSPFKIAEKDVKQINFFQGSKLGVFFSISCFSQTGYFSQDDLAKFGYTSNMKEDFFKIIIYFKIWHTRAIIFTKILSMGKNLIFQVKKM